MTQDTAAQPYLMLRDPEGNMTRVPLDELPVTLGRRSTNTVQLLDPTISRDHAHVDQQDGEYVIVDLGSTHGTFVNHERIQRHALSANDRIRLGGALGHTLTFRSGGEFTMLIGTTGATPGVTGTTPDMPQENRQGNMQSLTALLEISKALNSSLRLKEVLEKVMDAVIALTDGERCLMMLGESADDLEIAARRNLTREAEGSDQYSKTVVRAAYDTGEAQILTDVSEDDRFSAQQSIVGLHLRTVMCVPLRLSHFGAAHGDDDDSDHDSGPRILGVLYVDRRSPTRHFSDQDLSLLESFASHAAIAIDNARLYEEALEKRRMEEDLRVAHRIQRSLLLSEFPEDDWYAVHAFNLPSRGVGGDYYEFFAADEGALGFAVGDVSGKGIPAAMLMATLQAAFLAAVRVSEDLADVCAHLNQFIVERTSPERYATFFCGKLYPDGRLIFVNAGHNPALLFRDGEPEQLFGGGLPIGLFPDRTYEIQETRMEPGDVLLVFSDGVTEANNVEEEEFGEERLSHLVQGAPSRVARDLSRRVLGAVEEFSTGAGQADDITLMVIGYHTETSE
jgi:serine phosphatase RsbU (regulator of sigma subunit)